MNDEKEKRIKKKKVFYMKKNKKRKENINEKMNGILCGNKNVQF